MKIQIKTAGGSVLKNRWAPVLFSVIIIFNFALGTNPDKGIIFGRITDKESGKPLMGANIQIENSYIGTATDVEGNYYLANIPGGIHTVIATYIGYEKKTIPDIRILANSNIRIDIELSPDALNMDTVMVKVTANKNTDASLLQEQKKSLNIEDGISASRMSRNGDSNAAEALRRVAGVTVREGKYVSVRGLGNRYTLIQLDGGPVASPEPEKKTTPTLNKEAGYNK
jgi:hypothetical protein